VVPLGVGATLGGETGAPDVDDGPAVDESGGASGSTFDPVPGVAPLGDGAMGRLSVLDPDTAEPGSGSVFEPVPGLAPEDDGEGVEAPVASEARLPGSPCLDDPPVVSVDGDGGFCADGALLPLSSTGVTARAMAGMASAAATAAVARCRVTRMDMTSSLRIVAVVWLYLVNSDFALSCPDSTAEAGIVSK
jgi:hypothetical protein